MTSALNHLSGPITASIVIAKMLPAFCIVQCVEIQWCILSDIVESRYNTKQIWYFKQKSNANGSEHRLDNLSHTWVRYPGFWGHGVKCPILTTVVPGFPAIWLAVPFGANGAHLGICTLPEKNLFCVWNKLFLGEIKFSQSRTRPVKSLWWQIVPMQESTNGWKNLTIF